MRKVLQKKGWAELAEARRKGEVPAATIAVVWFSDGAVEAWQANGSTAWLAGRPAGLLACRQCGLDHFPPAFGTTGVCPRCRAADASRRKAAKRAKGKA